MVPRRVAQAMRAAALLVLAVSLVAMLWLGGSYVVFAWDQETPVLNWNFGLVYLAIPVGALLMLDALGADRRALRARARLPQGFGAVAGGSDL